jgi:hypothetical protein
VSGPEAIKRVSIDCHSLAKIIISVAGFRPEFSKRLHLLVVVFILVGGIGRLAMALIEGAWFLRILAPMSYLLSVRYDT